jgi:epoxyqueuosine reductase
MNLSHAVKAQARALGFDLVAIAPAGPSPDWDRYQAWIQRGWAGEMGYLARHLPLKRDVRALAPDARALILVGLNYAHHLDPALLQDPSRGRISLYALGRDYHKIMRKALIELDRWLAAQSGRSTRGRVFVDSAPVLERSWAARAGLGFIGKNTCLIHPRLGSWLFLGGLLVPEALSPDPAPGLERHARPDARWRFADGGMGTCGACTRCLDVCPTDALVAPRQLDARLCISYLTIEQRGPIPPALRPKLGNWVFGCDLCQEVCPWNRKAPPASHPQLQPHPDRIAPPLLDLLALDETGFQRRFAGSPVMRARWRGFMRNVCVAAGNWGDPAAADALAHHLWHSPLLVAEHAAWALARLRQHAGYPHLDDALTRIEDPARQAVIRRAINA